MEQHDCVKTFLMCNVMKMDYLKPKKYGKKNKIEILDQKIEFSGKKWNTEKIKVFKKKIKPL